MKILVINGCNINMIGIREPELYGTDKYSELVTMIREHAAKIGVDVEVYQSNHEGDLVDKIQQAYGDVDGIIINAGAYTHTSIAILDALKAVNIPTVEVHVTDPDIREDFRKVNFVRPACIYTIKGQGFPGYLEALDHLKEYLS
ncbi:MAG: 3-dehydroquinate dehydratase [Lachnospiraceae bacterium]|nr:3-dehydroquinate dehydratase [Lachnospiraceae bacterium]